MDVLVSKAQPMQMRAIDIISVLLFYQNVEVCLMLFLVKLNIEEKKHNFRISEGGIGGHFFALFMELTPKQSHVLKNKQHQIAHMQANWNEIEHTKWYVNPWMNEEEKNTSWIDRKAKYGARRRCGW